MCGNDLGASPLHNTSPFDRGINKMQLIAIDEVFREDLRLIKRYSPTCEKKIEEHMSRIEDSFRTKHLMRLQDIEEVREQFQDFADNMQQKE